MGLLLSDFRTAVPVYTAAFYDTVAFHGTEKQKDRDHCSFDSELCRIYTNAGSVYDLAEPAYRDAVLRQSAVGLAVAPPARHLYHAQFWIRLAAPAACFLLILGGVTALMIALSMLKMRTFQFSFTGGFSDE